MEKGNEIKTVVPALRFPEFQGMNGWEALLSGENSLKQLLLTNNQLVTRLIKFFD